MERSAYIQSLLPKIKACFDSQPVRRAWLFGSLSRGEERPDSDADFLVEYIKSDDLSLLTTARLYRSLKNALGREVDVVEDGYLMPFAEESVNREKILVYERASER